MEILKKIPQWALLLLLVYAAVLVSYAVYDGRRIDFWPPTIHAKDTAIGSVDADKGNARVVERIKSGKEFLVAFSETNVAEPNCLKAEDGSPLGDFLVGAVYRVRYNKDQNKLYTKGLNQGRPGCPWEDDPDADPGTDLVNGKMIMWGRPLKFNERGSVYSDGDHVGYILFPPA